MQTADATANATEGAVSFSEAGRLLGNASRSTVNRMVQRGEIRKVQISPGRVGILRQSIVEHLAKNEA